MAQDKTSKIMAMATVAMALSASIQAIVALQEFSMNIEKNWLNLTVVVVVGILVLVTFYIAWGAFQLQKAL